MKTAIQLAIEKFKHDSNLSIQSGSCTDAAAYDYVVEELTKLLEKEKEQIVKAVEDTRGNIVPRMFISENLSGEEYYNQKYNKNK